jgi:SulP family sulfate permease
MAQAVEIEGGGRLVSEDEADTSGRQRSSYTPDATRGDIIVYRIRGAFFFGATSAVSAVLDRIGERPKMFVLDFTDVPLVDSTAAKALESFVTKLHNAGTTVFFAGASRSVRRTLLTAGLRRPHVRYAATAEDVVAQMRDRSA